MTPVGDTERTALLDAIDALHAAEALDVTVPRSAAILGEARTTVERAAARLDHAVAEALAGGVRVGTEVWTCAVARSAPLIVAQVVGLDTTDPDALACSTFILTADGGIVAQAQHAGAWDTETDRPVPDGLAPVYYERWTGHGFVMSGTCHPVSRGMVAVHALGRMNLTGG